MLGADDPEHGVPGVTAVVALLACVVDRTLAE